MSWKLPATVHAIAAESAELKCVQRDQGDLRCLCLLSYPADVFEFGTVKRLVSGYNGCVWIHLSIRWQWIDPWRTKYINRAQFLCLIYHEESLPTSSVRNNVPLGRVHHSPSGPRSHEVSVKPFQCTLEMVQEETNQVLSVTMNDHEERGCASASGRGASTKKGIATQEKNTGKAAVRRVLESTLQLEAKSTPQLKEYFSTGRLHSNSKNTLQLEEYSSARRILFHVEEYSSMSKNTLQLKEYASPTDADAAVATRGGATWKVNYTAEADSRSSRTEQKVEIAPGIPDFKSRLLPSRAHARLNNQTQLVNSRFDGIRVQLEKAQMRVVRTCPTFLWAVYAAQYLDREELVRLEYGPYRSWSPILVSRIFSFVLGHLYPTVDGEPGRATMDNNSACFPAATCIHTELDSSTTRKKAQRRVVPPATKKCTAWKLV
ncbi:hypothetical protein K438DRAFT_1765525 [Mycena galopus ATCC 62051]|nr:hypothetical protein K438DRAFT_1765525 [Mycena galopus ATCC 62051]